MILTLQTVRLGLRPRSDRGTEGHREERKPVRKLLQVHSLRDTLAMGSRSLGRAAFLTWELPRHGHCGHWSCLTGGVLSKQKADMSKIGM